MEDGYIRGMTRLTRLLPQALVISHAGTMTEPRPLRDGATPRPSSPSHRRVGVIHNPRSHSNRNARCGLEDMAARHPGLAFDTPASPADLRRALRRFAAEKVDLLVISGGDGTLRDVLTALPDAYPDGPPDLAILAAGNTNLAARALGISGTGPQGLERLLKAVRHDRLHRADCRLLEVGWIGQPGRTPMRGFFFGAAAFAEGKRIADIEIHRRHMHKGLAVAVTAATMVVRILFGDSDGLKRGTPMRIGLDDAPPRDADRFLLMATTLDRLMLGLWPFWGRGEGGIHWLEIEARPQRLVAALLAMAIRRPGRWMARKGYRSEHVSRVRIRLRQSFVLDGEFFDPGPEGILLSTPGQVTVVWP